MVKTILLILLSVNLLTAQNEFQIGRLKYGGGGDWYNDQSAEVNLLKFVNKNTNIRVKPEYKFVDVSKPEIYSFPFLFITGHGNFTLSNEEAENLRRYCELGGFIYIDDDYGLDNSVRKMVKVIFPEKELLEIPFNHEIYHIVYDFEYGPPKTHEHDNKPPQGFGIFLNKKLVLYYTYESNPSDGWADKEVHNDSEQTRLKALQFGTNIIVWSLTN